MNYIYWAMTDGIIPILILGLIVAFIAMLCNQKEVEEHFKSWKEMP